MRWDWQVVTWAAVALLLFAAETMAPGAFMLWLGFAAAAVFAVVLLFDIPGTGAGRVVRRAQLHLDPGVPALVPRA